MHPMSLFRKGALEARHRDGPLPVGPRQEEEAPRTHAGVPLLQGTDRFYRYRKGPWQCTR